MKFSARPSITPQDDGSPAMLTFKVDFNDQTDDGRVVVLSRLASGLPASHVLGTRRSCESEGNRCRGRVERIDGALVYVLPDWDTWSAGSAILKTPARPAKRGKIWCASSPPAPGSDVTGATAEAARAELLERLGGCEPFELEITSALSEEREDYHHFGTWAPAA